MSLEMDLQTLLSGLKGGHRPMTPPEYACTGQYAIKMNLCSFCTPVKRGRVSSKKGLLADFTSSSTTVCYVLTSQNLMQVSNF